MSHIDFTELKKRNKAYAGANGNKISVIYEGEQYMLKFPTQAKRNQDMSYSNSCFSEYLGCQIYESIGVPVQKTLLGTYRVKEKKKIVVACRDFTKPGVTLQDFASMKNQMIDSERNGYGTELSDILYTFDEQTAVDSGELSDRFWDMFIVDALIGNWDRHNGNWGFLYNAETDEMTLAPVYDCGSSQIRYFDFISSLQNEDCNRALERILPRIDMDQIRDIIDTTPFLSDLQKRFYLTVLTARKARILDFSFASLEKRKII